MSAVSTWCLPPKPLILLLPEAFWLGVHALSCKIVIVLWEWCPHCVLLSKGWLFIWGVTSHVYAPLQISAAEATRACQQEGICLEGIRLILQNSICFGWDGGWREDTWMRTDLTRQPSKRLSIPGVTMICYQQPKQCSRRKSFKIVIHVHCSTQVETFFHPLFMSSNK